MNSQPVVVGQTGFFPSSEPGDLELSLKVISQDVPDPITRGRSWRGTPYQLGEKAYAHGIAYNATKQFLVRTGKPADRFTAEIGLENNDDTLRGEKIGNGSVVFHVLVAGKELFTSPVLRRKDGPTRINIPLNGARQFEIGVTDAGDGRGWDQALWAEAEVLLQDGRRLRLQDAPLVESIEHNPFGISFVYGGSNSAAVMPKWSRQAREQQVDSKRTRRDLTYRDPSSGLEIRVEAVQFSDFPAVEWVAYLSNRAATNTPLLENICSLDAILPIPNAGTIRLHSAKGAVASFDDFAPQVTDFKPGKKVRFQPGGGRSSSQVLPFFNLEGANGGVIAAIGWSGEWAAEFSCDQRGEIRLTTGLDRTRLVLNPGETIRTPRMLLLFYEGDHGRGQNLLRQFLLAQHRPQRGGQRLVAPITCGNWGATRASIHLSNVDQIIRHNLPIDYYWIDAEWFGTGGWPVNVGNWEVKKDLYPAGFKPISDALRKSGRELLLWFEPERVFKGTPWYKEHRDWLLDVGGDSLLFNLGDPEARKFLTDFISAKVNEFGLGCYRQDFNIDPLPFWQAADAPDRQGISEIRYIEGLYAFWDELLARHPDLIIDNCASGGRRIDLETVGRATPFWRTDGPRDAIAHQCHSYGLLPWVPLSATSQDRALDDYEFRSSMCSGLCLNWWVAGDVPAEEIPADFPFAWAKRTLDGYLKLREFYYGDFYPLTPYSQGKDLWMAYQLDRPDLGKGLLVVLRRPDSPYETARFKLRGLDASVSYRLTDIDSGKRSTGSGKNWLQSGLAVTVKGQPGSSLLVYERR